MKIEVINTLQHIETETVVIGIQKHHENTKNWAKFAEFFGATVESFITTGEVSSDVKVFTKLPVAISGSKLKRVLFVGLGEGKKLSSEELRNAFGLTGKELKKLKAGSFSIWLDSFETQNLSANKVARLAAEGLKLGFYEVEHYKTTSNEVATYLDGVTFVTEDASVVDDAKLGEIFAHAVNEARSLINLPPNMLTATDMAKYAINLAEQYGLEIEVLSTAELKELGMGGILSVNQGSVEEAKLITIKYMGDKSSDEVLGLVGKGVTYDTGGYSLKPRASMIGMKGDMGGAAAVLGAMRIVGELKPNKNVVGVIGSTDNMVSGTAFKPDDVITMYSGKTVEVLNTDAEGRLVLADAMTYCLQQGATKVINLATLTGGVITALGMDKTGALTNNDEFYTEFVEASKQTDEFVWQLPLTENDKKRIRKSDIADLNNSPGRDGHMIFGGGFVGEFVEGKPWIHLDIAGTSDALAAYDLGPKGGTGAMVRTLGQYILTK